MRRLEPAQLTIGLFWTAYVILAVWTLYQMTDPVNLVLMVVLGGYAIALAAAVIGFLLRSTRHVNESHG